MPLEEGLDCRSERSERRQSNPRSRAGPERVTMQDEKQEPTVASPEKKELPGAIRSAETARVLVRRGGDWRRFS